MSASALDSSSSLSTSLPISEKSCFPCRCIPKRWLVWIMIILSSFGHYIFMAIPSALETFMTGDKSAYKLNHAQASLFATICNYPSIVTAILGGMAADRWGAKYCRVWFATICTIGQLIVFLGAYYKDWTGLLVGRFLFGVGSEAFQTTTGSIILQSFAMSDDIAFALSTQISIGKLITAGVYNFIPQWIKDDSDIVHSVTAAFGYSLIASGICIVLCIALHLTDRRQVTKEKCTDSDHDVEQGTTCAPEEADEINEQTQSTSSGLLSWCGLSWCLEYTSVAKFGSAYWWLVLAVMPLSYLSTNGWMISSPKYLERVFNLQPSMAGMYVAIINIKSAVIGPFTAFLVDRSCFSISKANWMIFGSFCLLASHLIFWGADNETGLVFAVVMMGIGSSVATNIGWSFIGFLVDAEYLSTAMAISCSVVSLFLAVWPPLIQMLTDLKIKTPSMTIEPAEIVNVVIAVMVVVSTYAMIRADKRKKSSLS